MALPVEEMAPFPPDTTFMLGGATGSNAKSGLKASWYQFISAGWRRIAFLKYWPHAKARLAVRKTAGLKTWSPSRAMNLRRGVVEGGEDFVRAEAGA
jgi:hypothetical protein